jgi:predicted protein tyrosine phosphatase
LGAAAAEDAGAGFALAAEAAPSAPATREKVASSDMIFFIETLHRTRYGMEIAADSRQFPRRPLRAMVRPA